MEPGSLFLLLFFVIAPGVPVLLLWRGIVRACREAPSRSTIIVLNLAAVSFWLVVSDFVLDIIFDTAWGLAHTRPFPGGLLPEGWSVYGYLAAYSVLGAVLVWTVNKLPRRQTA